MTPTATGAVRAMAATSPTQLAALAALALAGLAVGVRVGRARARSAAASVRAELRRVVDEQRADRVAERDAAVSGALAQLDTMHRAVTLREREAGEQRLAGERALVERGLQGVRDELDRLGRAVQEMEREREVRLGELTNELARQREGVASLTQTTDQLRRALASPTARGQWGERMAEDVLRLAGLLEGVSYRKQTAAGGGIPDYTFLLPRDLVLHMDVKFPLDNYLRGLESTTEPERRRFRDRFLRDVRDRIAELDARGYLEGSPDAVDCLLLFIPNEQVYAFVHEHGPELVDDALRRKIVLCSPLTLYAVVSVVRQAVDYFHLEQTSDEILSALGEFATEWERYCEQLDAVHRRFDGVAKEYEALTGTRRRALRRPLDRIESLRGGAADPGEDRDGPAPIALDA